MHGLVHTKTRNRLSTDSVSSILKVRHALGRDKAKAKTMVEVRKNIAMDILFGPQLESSNVTAERGATMISSSHEHPCHSAVDESKDAALAQRVLDLLRNESTATKTKAPNTLLSSHSIHGWMMRPQTS